MIETGNVGIKMSYDDMASVKAYNKDETSMYNQSKEQERVVEIANQNKVVAKDSIQAGNQSSESVTTSLLNILG